MSLKTQQFLEHPASSSLLQF